MTVKRELLDKKHIKRLIKRLIDDALAALTITEVDGGTAYTMSGNEIDGGLAA